MPYMRTLIYFCLIILFISCSSDHQKLKKAFYNPAPDAMPWVYWYWMNGNVTKEGITADLEAMKNIGIGGAMMMFIGDTIHRKGLERAYEQMSPEWWDLIRHTFTEAKRIDIQIGMSACDGWATAGGPMISPELSMKKLVWSISTVEGGQQIGYNVPMPPLFSGTYQNLGEELKAEHRYYKDIACYAIPDIKGISKGISEYNFSCQSNIPGLDVRRLFDGNVKDQAIQAEGQNYFQITFQEPFLCRSIRIFSPIGSWMGYPFYAASMEVQVSQDGQNFKPVAHLEPDQHSWQEDGCPVTFRIPETTAKVFRFLFDTGVDLPVTMRYVGSTQKLLNLSEIELSPFPWIDHIEAKAAFRSRIAPQCKTIDPVCISIDPKEIINVSELLDSTGVIHWNVPAGKWTLLRLGYTITGEENETGGGGKGLESDKLSEEATRILFDGWLSRTMKEIRSDKVGKALPLIHVDSWEACTQNWTDKLITEFQQRRGYDPLPWLPVLIGIPVGSLEEYENFLYDFRLTIAELMNDNFYGKLAAMAHEKGVLFSAEATGPVMISDGMLHHKYTDLPMGEFWRDDPSPYDKPEDILEAASAAHIYNRNIVQAESFTDLESKWYEHPFALKAQGDYNFCKGVNKIFFHVYVQQPFVGKQPGATLDHIGLHFNRGQTWWNQSRAWIDYITTCQSILQKGYQMADILCFTGMDIPNRGLLPDQLNVEIPEGYHYLSINADALLNLAYIENGKLTLPNGASHKILILPDESFLGNGKYSIELIKKMEEFVSAGLIVVGPKPADVLGLMNHDSNSKEFKKLVNAVWGDCNGKEITTHVYGKGQVYWGETLENVLVKEKIQPDLIFNENDSMKFIHKKFNNEDIYFISNQQNCVRKIECSFRQSGKIPEIWNPQTKTIQKVYAYTIEDERVTLRLDLAPYESIFIIFGKAFKKQKHLTSFKYNSVPISLAANSKLYNTSFCPADQPVLTVSQAGNYELVFSDGSGENIEINDSLCSFPIKSRWKISFEANKGIEKDFSILTDTLFSLTKHDNPDVKHFSGTARYETTFDFDNNPVDKEYLYYLDLGKVDNIARVELNGKDAGLAWTSPFVVDITNALMHGENRLVIEVTNTWNNRIVRDMEFPLEERVSYFMHYEEFRNANDDNHVLKNAVSKNLFDAGLSGPCSIKSCRLISINSKQIVNVTR